MGEKSRGAKNSVPALVFAEQLSKKETGWGTFVFYPVLVFVKKFDKYSLQEIMEKHLDLFIPYTVLRLRPRLKSRYPLTGKDSVTLLGGFFKKE